MEPFYPGGAVFDPEELYRTFKSAYVRIMH